MSKINSNGIFLQKNSKFKIILTMKITLLLIVVASLNATAEVYSQYAKLNLNVKDGTIEDVFKAIEKQSDFNIFYKVDQIDVEHHVSVNAKDQLLSEVLDKVLAEVGATYTVLDKIIVIRGKNDANKQQGYEISGTVTATQTGEPLPGVNILEKGTSNGTTTDINGKYTLSVSSEQSTLVFSYVGYLSETVPVANQTTINISLSEDIASLEQVVVIGYGVQKKSLVTGAISSVNSEDIQDRPVSRPEQILQGKTPGVQVIPASGSPGAGMQVRIRGYGSNGNSNPIYIVDGVKTGDINYLDPNDIASMEVLKDAASSAIYGAEGGNGVVIITTKKGQAGKTRVSYDFQHAFQSAGKLPKLMNTAQYAQYMNEAGLIANVDQTYNTDWLNEIFDKGSLTKHNLSFSGGNEKSSYYLSLSYLNNDGIIVGNQDKFERYTIRLNSEHKLNKWLKVGNNLTYANYTRSTINENSGEFGGVISSALQIDPATPVEYTSAIPSSVQSIIDANPGVLKAPDGNYYGISQYVKGEIVNPFVTMAITNGNINRDNINGNVYADLTPIKGLTITSRVGFDIAYQNNHWWNPTYYYTAERSNPTTKVHDVNDKWYFWSWENFASYTKSFGNHNITLLAGMEAQDWKHNFTDAQGGPMILEDPSFAQLNFLSTQTGDLIQGTVEENKLLSYFGRASYNYKDKYLLQGSIRRDGGGLSQVPESGRWGVFPSVSAGWVISNEDFFPKTFISNLKLRGSYGQNGSLSNLGGYRYASNITATSSNLTIQYPLSDGSFAIALEPAQTSNPSLKWETSVQTDFGMDLRALNDKLSFSVDYYKKTTKDLITPFKTPLEVGNTNPPINGGDVENKGFEFALGYKNYESALKYSVNLNLSTLHNEVTYINPQVGRLTGVQVGTGWNATIFEQGASVWHFFGYKTNGIDPATGDPIFLKLDGTETNAAGVTANDMQDIGSPIPKLIFGGSINLSYMNFDLSVTASGMSGNKVMLAWIRNDRNTVNRPTYFFDDRWTPSNTTGSKPGAATDTKTWNSDQIVFDGSFLRIQQIQLGYTLPASILNLAKISKLRLYISMDNYFTFTKYPGMDPQASPEYNNNPSK